VVITGQTENNVNRNKYPPFSLAFLALCTAALLVGCATDPSSPGVEPEIINGTQSFEFQVTAVQNYTSSWSYTWNNSSTTASIDHSSSLSDGSATLTITDADGASVYNRSLAQDGSFETNPGSNGDWTLTITLSSCSGDLNFRAEEGS